MPDPEFSHGQLQSARTGKRPRAAAPVSVDPEWLSVTIGTIYDCVLQPANWRAVIEAIAAKLSFASAVMDIVRSGSATHTVLVDAGIDSEYRNSFKDYVGDSIALWGGQSVLETWPLEEPAVASQIIPIEHKRRNRYYIDILEPRGLTDGVVLPLVREPNLFCYFGLNRHFTLGDVSHDVVDSLRLLAPHLRRAVILGNLLDLKAIERATFESVLTAMAYGVVLVDGNLHVVHANPAAMDLVSRSDVASIRQGKFFAHGLHAQSSLQLAVNLAAENESQMTRRGLGVPAQGLNGETAVLHVLPLNRGTIRQGIVQRAVAAIFLTPQQGPAHLPIDAIAQLYDLTPAEAQIFASLAKGTTLDETAKSLGTAKSTTRTHLLRIFEKTGCQRQAELVALGAQHSLQV